MVVVTGQQREKDKREWSNGESGERAEKREGRSERALWENLHLSWTNMDVGCLPVF